MCSKCLELSLFSLLHLTISVGITEFVPIWKEIQSFLIPESLSYQHRAQSPLKIHLLGESIPHTTMHY